MLRRFVVAAVLAAGAFAQGQTMPSMTMPSDQAETPTKEGSPSSRGTPSLEKEHAQQAAVKREESKSQHDSSMPGATLLGGSQQEQHQMLGMIMGGSSELVDKPPKGTSMFNMQGMHTGSPMTLTPANGSLTQDAGNLQEPENPARRTGTKIPAPMLLADVAARPSMDLKTFLAMAASGNPTLAAAATYVRRAAAQAKQAGLYPNPSVGYQGEQIRGGDYGGGEQGGYVKQTIVLGGKLGLRRDIYNQQRASDEILVEEQTSRVRNDVTQTYYAALSSQAMVVVRQRLVAVALDAVETVHQLANVGQADAPDILQAEVESEQAKTEFVTAQRDFLQNFQMLAALCGRRDLAASPLAGDLTRPPELDAEQQVSTIVAMSPTVRRMQQEVVLREARLRDAKRESVPDLELKAGEQNNGEHLPDRPINTVGPQTFASASVAIPLWNRNQGNTVVAQAEIEHARQEVAREQLSLKQTAEPLVQRYLSAKFTADRYRTELIPRAQRAHELYLQKYQEMAEAYPQVLVSQRTLFQLQVGYLTALREVWMDAASLNNFTLSGGLVMPSSTGSDSTTINLPNASAGSSE